MMKQIQIQGYKSINNLLLKLTPINIIIGANGSGKSNFLSFFEFLKKIKDKNLRETVSTKGGTNKFLHKGDKVTEEIKARLFFPHTNSYSFTIKKGDDNFIFTHEGLWYENIYYNNPIEIAQFSEESKLQDANVPRAEYIRNYINGLKKYHFHDTGSSSPFNKETNIDNDGFFLYDDGKNLASFLYNIKIDNKITYNLIVKTIQSIAPFFLDFFLLPNQQGYIKLRWLDKYNSIPYGANELSDGTIRFIALATLFLQPTLPETIIIDEPELGLHPFAISKLSGLIKSVALKGTQVIVATQSTDLISHFIPEDIITVDQVNGESKFERLNSKTLQPWLDDYTLDELWKRNIISTGHPNY